MTKQTAKNVKAHNASQPNTVLPTGAVLLREPRVAKIAGWVEMTFDARVERHGMAWYRVKDGFGDGQYPREDWVADLPHCCVAVSDYHWRFGSNFGHSYGSFDAAVLGQMREDVAHARQRAAELRAKAEEAEAGAAILQAAVTRAAKEGLS